jgi:hypothetical protein
LYDVLRLVGAKHVECRHHLNASWRANIFLVV